MNKLGFNPTFILKLRKSLQNRGNGSYVRKLSLLIVLNIKIMCGCQQVMTKASDQKKDKFKGEATEKPVEVININTPPDNPTFKRLIRQLRDARKEVSRLKEEILTRRMKMKELMGMYHETLKLARFIARIFLPLHRKVKTRYRQKKSIQSQNRKLKEEFHSFKNDLAQRNLNVLVQDAIERNEPTIEGSYPTTRRSARLRK